MSIYTETPGPGREPSSCMGCRGKKGAPLAAVVYIGSENGLGRDDTVTIVLCQECGRDAANAIGFMCIRDGGWLKLEPRKRKPRAR